MRGVWLFSLLILITSHFLFKNLPGLMQKFISNMRIDRAFTGRELGELPLAGSSLEEEDYEES